MLDLGFIAYDLAEIGYSYATTGTVDPVSVAALGADVAAAFVPGLTGGGVAVRVSAKYGDDVVHAARLGPPSHIDSVAEVGGHAKKPAVVSETASDARKVKNAEEEKKLRAADVGRAGKQTRLRELANDDKLGTADRGWIK